MNYEPSSFVQNVEDGCTLAVRVHPGARKNDVAGLHAGAVKISIAAPPTDGRANEALIAYLAALLKVPRTRISLVSGASGRSKVLRITGKSAAEVQAALLPIESC
ncbi:hypothetical protein GCM10011507_20120 [Edaphobacter acidisoli]|uniref:UPF0235 protein GCM10011507_20120 n=1 Tax=Edaphobacter acidisoli TaxID=2040573 RepID=A0A916RUT5_9BACT|nr:DUF167 domain-containing protein [Edaphobacter acidisoli]GGA68583.1 hypothetical protein GCM10011507_20120 [Edaphobacter acidisoli]